MSSEVAAALHDAPHGGQRDHSQPGGQGHPGGGGAAQHDGVALVRRAAVDFLFVAEQQGAVGGGVAAGGLTATQREESHVGDPGESCGDTRERLAGAPRFRGVGAEHILLLFK